jgi:hypothetical protein
MDNKKQSPNKFLGSISAALGGVSGRSGNPADKGGFARLTRLLQQEGKAGIEGLVGTSSVGEALRASQAARAAEGAQAAIGSNVEGEASIGSSPSIQGIGSSFAAQAAIGSTQDAGASMGVSAQQPAEAAISPSAPQPSEPSSGPSILGGKGQKFEITPVQMTYDTPSPANMKGNAKPLFNSSASNASNMMFGDVGQRQRSMQNKSGDIQSSLFFKDQTGDNKVTQADVIKARTEGYKK